MAARMVLPVVVASVLTIGAAIALLSMEAPSAAAALRQLETPASAAAAKVGTRDPESDRAGGPGEAREGAREGVASGEAALVDPSHGVVVVALEGGTRSLRGTPAQLAGIAPGDAVALRWRVYGDELWLVPAHGRLGADSFTTWGSLVGSVESVDRGRGELSLGGQLFLLHPALAAALAPEQRVRVRFARVGGILWALSVDGGEGGPRL